MEETVSLACGQHTRILAHGAWDTGLRGRCQQLRLGLRKGVSGRVRRGDIKAGKEVRPQSGFRTSGLEPRRQSQGGRDAGGRGQAVDDVTTRAGPL